jgi:hypothetical protein
MEADFLLNTFHKKSPFPEKKIDPAERLANLEKYMA